MDEHVLEELYEVIGSRKGAAPEDSYTAKLIANLRLLVDHKPDEPILIHMKTCGGDWVEGMAIYDAIQACPCPVHIINYSHARSMSSIIFQAGDLRIMMPNSYFMFHQGTYGTDGTWKSVKSEVDFYKKVADPTMLDIYVDAIPESENSTKFLGWDKEKIRRFLKKEMDKTEEVYLTAPQAIEWGFADIIFDRSHKDRDWRRAQGK